MTDRESLVWRLRLIHRPAASLVQPHGLACLSVASSWCFNRCACDQQLAQGNFVDLDQKHYTPMPDALAILALPIGLRRGLRPGEHGISSQSAAIVRLFRAPWTFEHNGPLGSRAHA